MKEEGPSLKKDEEMLVAGKASSVNEGGLAGLVFGKGQAKDESSEEGVMKVVEGGSDPSDNEDPEAGQKEEVKLEEIQLDIELKKEETAEEKTQFIQKLFIKPLLSRVFKFIDEKQAMESKRKTWNLKHQLEQVQTLKQKKSDWEYHPSQQSSLKSRMDALFREHEDAGADAHNHELQAQQHN